MKTRLFLWLAIFILLTFLRTPICSATVLTFDDIPKNTGTASLIPSSYQGLVWSNFGVVNGILRLNNFPFITNGFYYGVASFSNVAFNASGTPAEIDSPGTNFNFLSAYLTGGWRSNQNIEIQAFRSGSLVYDQIVVAGATNATLVTLNYPNIDRLYFTSFGGDPAFSFDGGAIMAMDNFTFEFVPEPSAFLLTSAGVLLWPVLKRKRVS